MIEAVAVLLLWAASSFLRKRRDSLRAQEEPPYPWRG